MGAYPACPAGVRLVLDFVADFVVAGRARVGPRVAVRLLQHIAAAPEQQDMVPQPQRGVRPAGEANEGGSAERERRFLAVMMGGGFGGERPLPGDVATAALAMAQRAGFLAAQARVGHPIKKPYVRVGETLQPSGPIICPPFPYRNEVMTSYRHHRMHCTPPPVHHARGSTIGGVPSVATCSTSLAPATKSCVVCACC